MAQEQPPAPPPVPVDRRRLALLLVPVAIFTIASNVATVLSARLVNDHPLLLIGLDARIRHLVLAVASGVDLVPYLVVGFLRLVVADPLFYLLGYWYGDAGLRWLERKAGGVPATIAWTERWFPKASYPLVALLPNNLVCLLAGSTRMAPRTFVTLNVGGTLVRLGVLWWLAKAFEEPLDDVLDVIQRYQWPLTIGLFALVLVQSTRQAARSQLGAHPIEQAAGELEDELRDGELREDDTPPRAD